LYGFISFNDYYRNHGWTNDHIELLKAMAKVITGVIQRTKMEEKTHSITARKQRQAEIISSIAVSPRLAGGDVQELATELTEAVSQAFAIQRVGVWFFDENRTKLVNVDNYSAITATHSSGAALFTHEYSNELATLKHNKYVAADEPLTDPRLSGYLESYIIPNHITAMLDAVIRHGSDVLGILCFEHVGKQHTWEEDEIVFACQLADQLALAAANAERRKAEKALQDRDRQLQDAVTRANQMTHTAEQANLAKSEFLANMSHELRTPLHVILALSEALLEQFRGPLNERQQASLRNIESSGRHLLDLINDVLDLAKVEAGRLDIILETISVPEICQASLAFVHEMAAGKNLQLSFNSEQHRLSMLADPKRLRQILVNLLTNAVKFTPTGGSVSLNVYTLSDQNAICFTVIDTGIGMALDEIKRLFQPFIQLDSSLSRHHEGTGLGLVLVQRLTEAHGGSIEVESEPGKGSRFTINLPIGRRKPLKTIGNDVSMGSARSVQFIESSESEIPVKAKKQVLLAENNEPNINVMREYLEDHGCIVTIARNGKEALARAMETKPDVVLMDIQMPEMDGLEATRQFRQMSAYNDVPIIALTALAMPGDRERCLQAGANEYMTKPVGLSKLIKIIHMPEGDSSDKPRLLTGTSHR
jgi:signal transduction histidine kinase/CheY-like chemotaxis protein